MPRVFIALTGFSIVYRTRRMPLPVQQPAQGSQVVQEDQAREHVLAQFVELVVDQAQGVEAPLCAGSVLGHGDFFENRPVRVVDRCAQQADESVGAFKGLERVVRFRRDRWPSPPFF